MPKLASILAFCAAASMFSLETQALPGSPAPIKGPGPEVTRVRALCALGYYDRYGVCVPYAGPQAFGLPYAELPSVRLPYAELPPVRLPYAELPPVRLPYAELPPVRLPYAELPPVRLPYAQLPPVRLPYAEFPPARLPYVDLPVLGSSRLCPNGYSYYAAYRRCVRRI
jgi:hypothetical protein